MSGGRASSDRQALWTPSPEAAGRCRLAAFMRVAEGRAGRRFADFGELHRWSVDRAPDFWRAVLDWSELAVEGDREPVLVGEGVEKARFFPGLSTSYVQNVLSPRFAGGREALVGRDEEGGVVRRTRDELSARVCALASGLAKLGVARGERAGAVATNRVETIEACLATTALGATWSSTAPDLGPDAMRARFTALEPRVVFTHAAFQSHGTRRSLVEKVAALVAATPQIELVVSLDDAPVELGEIGGRPPPRVTTLAEVAAAGASQPLRVGELPRFAFDHPLFVLFSSGTTGPPKCIVHGAGGTLLEHVKEHALHGDLGPDDTLYFQTSAGWMMWNWLVSALAVGARVVVYDGSVSFPDETALWRVCEQERVTVFGTSPAYLGFCRDAGLVPRERADLSSLRAVQSTGSVLHESLFEWVKQNVADVPVQSISGGTDIVGCFVLGCPTLPVYAGEMQSVGLGLDVRVAAPDGTTTRAYDRKAAVGELVCAAPFPSRPVGLFGDPERTRFHEAYFAQIPGLWTHGDILELTERGTARIHGRSDGILNVRGIRIGPAEIYDVLATMDPIAEAMALEQNAPDEPGGSRLVLLVVLRPGHVLDRPLTLRIKKELATRCSMAHVPAVVADVAELPATHSGKRSERAARDVVNGRAPANLQALKNPACLEAIARHPLLAREGSP